MGRVCFVVKTLFLAHRHLLRPHMAFPLKRKKEMEREGDGERGREGDRERGREGKRALVSAVVRTCPMGSGPQPNDLSLPKLPSKDFISTQSVGLRGSHMWIWEDTLS